MATKKNEMRKALIADIAEDPNRVRRINSLLASAYSLMSIATLYVDEMADILHENGLYLPFVENRIKMMNGNFDGLCVEMAKLFINKQEKRNLAEDTNELRVMLDRYFGYAVGQSEGEPITANEFKLKWMEIASQIGKDDAIFVAGRVGGTWYTGGHGSRNTLASAISLGMHNGEKIKDVIDRAVELYPQGADSAVKQCDADLDDEVL